MSAINQMYKARFISAVVPVFIKKPSLNPQRATNADVEAWAHQSGINVQTHHLHSFVKSDTSNNINNRVKHYDMVDHQVHHITSPKFSSPTQST